MNDAARQGEPRDAAGASSAQGGAPAPLRVIGRAAAPTETPEWLERGRVRARAVWAVLAPPDLARVDRPSLGKVWRHAAYGEHLPAAGAARTAAYVYVVVVAMPVIAACYALAWTVERKSRAAVAASSIAVAFAALHLF